MNVDKEKLLDALRIVDKAINKKHPIDVFRFACIRDGKIMSFDSEVGVVARTELPFSCCVDCQRLTRIVTAATGSVDISMRGDKLVISYGQHKSVLNTVSSTAYPDFVQSTRSTMSGSMAGFSDAVKTALRCSTKTESESSIQGIGCRDNFVYGIDRGVSRFSRVEIAAKTEEEFVVTSRAALLISSLGDPSKVCVGKNTCCFVYVDNGIIVQSALRASSFPFDAIEAAISARTERSYDYVFPNKLAGVVDRVALLVNTRTESKSIRVTATGEELQVACEIAGAGVSSDSVPWKTSHRFTFIVDPEYISQAIRAGLKYVNVGSVVNGDNATIKLWDDKGHIQIIALRSR